ncbi:MAG: hypothetical protein RIR18_319 [Pseudomonadota bacterium]|jgi:CRP-like cAMP-binding protein
MLQLKSADAVQPSVKSILKHLPLFLALSDAQLDQIASEAADVRLEKGNILFHRGDPSTGFYVLVFGQIKLSVTSPQGSQKVVEIVSSRQSFGEAVMFLERPYPVTAEALCDTLLVHVSREKVVSLLEADHGFARRLLAGLSQRLHSLLQDVESYSLRSSMQRVIGYLLQQCPEDQNEVEIELTTSKLVIASRLNLTPETLSRVLHDLVKHQVVEVRGRTIYIPNVKQLQGFDV